MRIRTTIPSLIGQRTSVIGGVIAFDNTGLSSDVTEEVAVYHAGMSGFAVEGELSPAVNDAIESARQESAKIEAAKAIKDKTTPSGSGDKLADALQRGHEYRDTIDRLTAENSGLRAQVDDLTQTLGAVMDQSGVGKAVKAPAKATQAKENAGA